MRRAAERRKCPRSSERTPGSESVERHAEALGREIAGDECRVIEVEPFDAATLYLGLDGTGVLARKTEVKEWPPILDRNAERCEASTGSGKRTA